MIAPVKILVSVVIICLAPFFVFAQQFKYTAELDSVVAAGFYTIPVSPSFSAYIKTDFADIRIADKNNRWVPHILQAGKTALTADLFSAFPVLQNTITDSGKNLLVIENTKEEGIYNFALFLKNSAVSRMAKLSGSNNQQEWFIIDDNIAISRSYEMKEDEYLQEINFPLTKYRYLKIIVDNRSNDPLRITRAGFFGKPYKQITNYQENPVPAFFQKDSNNYSYIEVRQSNNYQFDKIFLKIGGAKFYEREVQLLIPVLGKGPISARRGKLIGNFKLLSASPAVFELPRTKAPLFFIVIKNGDNPPLKIENVLTQQQTFSLVAYLEQGNKYRLLMTDSLASFADYDLQSFKDSITSLQPLSYKNIQAIKKDTINNTDPGKNRWVWPTIILAAIVLCFFTYRLTTDMNQSK